MRNVIPKRPQAPSRITADVRWGRPEEEIQKTRQALLIIRQNHRTQPHIALASNDITIDSTQNESSHMRTRQQPLQFGI